jgi:hypothetical protein
MILSRHIRAKATTSAHLHPGSDPLGHVLIRELLLLGRADGLPHAILQIVSEEVGCYQAD